MLTRLGIKGFKNLLDVDIRFGPFTCIAGHNGVGKSNLFDAIRFLQLLTKHPIMEAAQLLREAKGRSPDPRSLFTTFQGYRADIMSFTAEMIVEREVQDDLGVPATASISALRYEVAFRLNTEEGSERLELVSESLTPISVIQAAKGIHFPTSQEFLDTALVGRRGGAFISTPKPGEITVHQEKHGGRKVPAPKSSRTVVGATASSDFPTVLAAHREMSSWQSLFLEPSAMRAPSFYSDSRTIDSRGGNLAGAIHRLQKHEPTPGVVYAELSNRLSKLIPDIDELRIRDDPRTETLTLEVSRRDTIYYPARSLSDGTLRFIVLATLSLDPQVEGVICLEEPENGIAPDRIPTMVELLKEIAVDPQYAIGPDNPMRQVVVNTHSPEVVKTLEVNELVYIADEEIAVADGARGAVASIFVPEHSWRAANGAPRIALGRLMSYLGNASPPETGGQFLLEYYRQDLQKA